MSEHTVYESAVKQMAHNEDRLAKLRHGLRELKIEAASQSLHDGNGNTARAAFARLEGAIEQLLTIAGVILLICLLAVSPAYAYAAAPDPTTGPNTVTRISGPNTFQDANGQWFTAFMYVLEAGGPPAPSHLSLGLCTRNIVDVVGWPIWSVGPDPTTGAANLKLDDLTLQPGETLTFSVILRGEFTSSVIPWSIKAGQQIINGTTWGPQCSPTNVSLLTFVARPIGLFGLFR
jgi:hypothetical protein